MNCTIFCSNICKINHHPLLKVLNETNRGKAATNRFKNILEGYQISGFSTSDNLKDSGGSMFSYPLLHWATVLGKINVVKLLLGKPFNVVPTTCSDQGETALHRLFVLWNGHIELKTFFEILDALTPCLLHADIEGNTVFHLCVQRMVKSCNNSKELKFWKEVLSKMIKSLETNSNILNNRDENGETMLHILVKQDKLIRVVEYVVCCGVDISVENRKGETALELAWRFSLSVYNLLMKLTHSKSFKKNGKRKSEKRTRASQGLSDTIDYTQFFKEEDEELDVNQSDVIGISESIRATNRISDEKFTTGVVSKNQSNFTYIDEDCLSPKQKKRKRYYVIDDSDDSESGEENIQFSPSSAVSNETDHNNLSHHYDSNNHGVTVPCNSPSNTIQEKSHRNRNPVDLCDSQDLLKEALFKLDISYEHTAEKNESKIRQNISDVISNIRRMCMRNGYINQPVDEKKIPEQSLEDKIIDKKISSLQQLLRNVI